MAGGTPANPAALVVRSVQGTRRRVVVPKVFRRGRRHEALTEPSSPGVDDEQPFWLAEKGVKPERVLVAPKAALLRYDSPPWMADQERWQHRRHARPHAPAPLRGVTTQELVEALGSVFSPPELDWELVGVAFVQWNPDPATPTPLPADGILEAPPWAVEDSVAPPDVPPPAGPSSASIGVAVRGRGRKWLKEHDEIMAAVRELSWEGYRSLIADMFRHDGFEVFGGEGPDADVIDMEVVRGAQRMLVSCQLRGLNEVGIEPLVEMADVALRNGADGVFIISDGDFTAEAWTLAHGREIVLVDRESLLGLVLDFTLGASREKNLTVQMRRLLSGLQSVGPILRSRVGRQPGPPPSVN
jgi:hypothetical protein